jgi:hypothetical protein
MTNYISSLLSYLSDYFRDRMSYYFYKNDNGNGNSKPENNELELFKFKIDEYVVENDIHLDIYKMYENLSRYNPVAADSKNIRFILNFIDNELMYEEKLGQFQKETNTNKIVDKIEKKTILTDLRNDFIKVKQIKHESIS